MTLDLTYNPVSQTKWQSPIYLLHIIKLIYFDYITIYYIIYNILPKTNGDTTSLKEFELEISHIL